jgi:hypothetical protein
VGLIILSIIYQSIYLLIFAVLGIEPRLSALLLEQCQRKSIKTKPFNQIEFLIKKNPGFNGNHFIYLKPKTINQHQDTDVIILDFKAAMIKTLQQAITSMLETNGIAEHQQRNRKS